MGIKRQNGASIVAFTVAIGFALLVGIIAWRLASQERHQSGYQQKTPATAGPQVDPNSGYIVMKEWGVRLKPQEGLQGVVYVVGSQRSVKGDNITFTTQELAAFGDACAGKVDGFTPLGMLVRDAVELEVPAYFEKKIGGYYYAYVAPQASCSEEMAARQIQERVVNPLFKPSIVTLEAAK